MTGGEKIDTKISMNRQISIKISSRKGHLVLAKCNQISSGQESVVEVVWVYYFSYPTHIRNS